VGHRTVWCTSGATAIKRNGRLQWSPADVNSAWTVRTEPEQCQKAHRTVNSACPVWHWTVRCPKMSELQQSKPSELYRLGDVAGALDCPVRPLKDSLPNGWFGGWGYKYPPTTTNPRIQVFQTSHSIQELVQSIQDTIQKNQSLSKSQIHSKHLETRERVFARVL
jgi:hypothetical protein